MRLLPFYICLCLFVLSACEKEENHKTRYKLTVTINTPDGEISGSSVREVSSTIYPTNDEDRPYRVGDSFKGEAVIIDLGERGILFGAMDTNPEYELYSSIRNMEGSGHTKGFKTKAGVDYLASLPVGTKTDVSKRHWPTFVTFTDMDDPKTVTSLMSIQRCYAGISNEAKARCRESGPYITENNLEEYFGEGVSIKSVTIEITDEPVTQGVVDQYLPWLDEVGGGYLDGVFTGGGPALSNILHGGNFRKGIKK